VFVFRRNYLQIITPKVGQYQPIGHNFFIWNWGKMEKMGQAYEVNTLSD